MRYALTVTVHVSDLYDSLPSGCRIADAEKIIKTMIKTEFEQKGIRFLDKEGLYPAIPYHMQSKMVGAFPEITIKQWNA